MRSHIHYNLVRGKIRGDFVSASKVKYSNIAYLLTFRREEPSGLAPESDSESLQILDWQRGQFEVGELLAFHGSNFIDIVYRAILKRKADPAGILHYTEFLDKGGNPRYVIEALRHSQEGRQIGVQVNGIRSAGKFNYISRPAMRLRMLLVRR